MRPIHVIPLASLAIVAALAIASLATAPPVDFPFVEPPPGDPLPQPNLHVGGTDLVGTLVDGDGAPVPDAGLSAFDDGRPIWTWTGADGSFVLRELDPGPIDVAVVARDFEATLVRSEVGAGPVELVLVRRIAPPPILPANESSDLTGSVRFSPLEDPSEGYEVALWPLAPPNTLGGGLPRRTRVSADGSFVFDRLAPGEYELRLLPPEARGGAWPDLLVDAERETFTYSHPAPSGEVASPPPLALVSRAGAIGGRVHDRRRTGRVTYLEGALVRVEPLDQGGRPDPRRFVSARTDAEGAYLLPHLPAGRYRVTVAAGKDRREVDVIVHAESIVDPDF